MTDNSLSLGPSGKCGGGGNTDGNGTINTDDPACKAM